MAEEDRWEKGMAKFKEVYCGDVAPLPRGTSDFFDLMIENLFGQVWTREALDQRDRRMLMLGAIAAMGESMTFGIQIKAALKNQELTPEQAREILVHMSQYVGYPRVAPLVGVVEQKIAEFAQASEKTPSETKSR
ncbi:MAG: carboxymuconolactone decarboxylase family protein [Myxococcota bacterium]|nr:carboxymuconolactone decarboxylase family protein [Myxococcota bacterium]